MRALLAVIALAVAAPAWGADTYEYFYKQDDQTELKIRLKDAGQGTWAHLVVGLSTPPCSGFGRTHVSSHVGAANADAILWTVTPGKKLYVHSLSLSAFNASTTEFGWLRVQDGSAEANTRGSVVIPTSIVGAAAQSARMEHDYPEPAQFSTDFRVVVASGTMRYSASFKGCEE